MKINLTPIELIDQLRAWFHPKDRVLTLSNDQWILSQQVAWETAISKFLALTGLVGFWPMSSIQRSTGNAYDLSGQGRTLSYNGNPIYNYSGLAPYIDLDGTGDYLSRADETDLDILGTEAIYAAPGLTLGGWFWSNALGASGLIAKRSAAAGNHSYWLRFSASNTVTMAVSVDGTAITDSDSTDTISTGTWYFCGGRFIPSTSMTVWLNGTSWSNTAAIPASIFNGNAALTVGGYSGGGTLLNGRASMCFLCASALSDTTMSAMFNQTRALYGV